MFVKLAVIACAAAIASAAYNGPLAGGLPAAQYPAGVSPQACPNYPDCTNPALAANPNAPVHQYSAIPQQYNPVPVPQYNPSLQYNQAPQYHQAPVSQYNPVLPSQYAAQPSAQYNSDVQQRLDRGEYIGDGDYHGEGLAEALAPGYAGHAQQYNAAPQYQQYNPVAYNAAPAHHQLPAGVGQAAQVPAGVDARACPNYPFCH